VGQELLIKVLQVAHLQVKVETTGLVVGVAQVRLVLMLPLMAVMVVRGFHLQ
jgi:hypothetical protein